MNKIYALPEDELRGGIYRRILFLVGKNRRSWQAVAAAVGLFGGLLSILLGVLDWAVVGLFAPSGALGSSLDAAGTVLFVVPLPLLALGAHCLDLLEKKAPALRRGQSSSSAVSRPDSKRINVWAEQARIKTVRPQKRATAPSILTRSRAK